MMLNNKIVVLSLCALLYGCGSVPLMSMYQLSKFDPLSADAEHLRVGVRLPVNVQVKQGGAVMELSAERSDTIERASEQFILLEDHNPLLLIQLNDEQQDGFVITVFRFNADDLDRLNTLREKITTWKQHYPDDTQGSLSIGVAGCRVGELTDSTILVSTFLKFKPNGKFIPLTRDVDLRQVAPDQFDNETLPLCLS